MFTLLLRSGADGESCKSIIIFIIWQPCDDAEGPFWRFDGKTKENIKNV